VSVNSETHVLGLWLGGGVTPAALSAIEDALRDKADEFKYTAANIALRTELLNIANACHAQLSKQSKPDSLRYL
jgi:hypothetical protein